MTTSYDRRAPVGRWLSCQARMASRHMATAVASPFLTGLLLLPQAWLLARVLHRAIVLQAAPAELILQLLGIAGLISVRAVVAAFGEDAGGRAAELIQHRLRGALFEAMLAKRPDWTAVRASGEMASAIVDQVAALKNFFARYMPSMIAATVLPLAFATAVMPVDVVVGLILLVTVPLIPLFMALIGWGTEAANRQHRETLLRLSGFFSDRLRGLTTLKLFGRVEAESARLHETGQELRHRTLAVLRIAVLSSAVLEFFAAIGVAAVALYVGLTYLGYIDLRGGRPLTLELGLFCLLMAPEAYLPLRGFAANYHDRAAARAAAEHIERLFETLPYPRPIPPAVTGRTEVSAPPGALSIHVASLRLQAPQDGKCILDDVSFDIDAGSHVAITGASGSGKSTLLAALGGLHDSTGVLQFGGVDLDAWAAPLLRQRIAILNQRPRLFHGSILDNIRLGREDASLDEVRAAAQRAAVLRFADALPDGLSTRVGEGGLGLSGGEAHRVALARVYLRKPDLILLDEPTAHLDAKTAERVLDGIREFAKARTLVVVTHSSRVAARMDRILYLAGGKVTDQSDAATLERCRSAA